ncbi:hypothetical protein IGI04_017966 [Brassica rapa subsp. trilocularis]|nr:hypothetical protein IGI04_017966 [Brassica rapa subsp. trilocularis]
MVILRAYILDVASETEVSFCSIQLQSSTVLASLAELDLFQLANCIQKLPTSSHSVALTRLLQSVGEGRQLGRMLCQADSQMTIKVMILDPSENCSASSLSYGHMVHSFDDSATVEEFATRCGVLTVEIEHVDVETINTYAKGSFLSAWHPTSRVYGGAERAGMVASLTPLPVIGLVWMVLIQFSLSFRFKLNKTKLGLWVLLGWSGIRMSQYREDMREENMVKGG